MSSPIRVSRSDRALAAEEKHRQRLSEKKATPNSNAFKAPTRSRQSASLGRPSHSPVYVPTRASPGTSSSLPRGGSEPRPAKQTTRASGGRVLSYSAMSAAVESGLNPALRMHSTAKPVARGSSASRTTASPDQGLGENPAPSSAAVPTTEAATATSWAPSKGSVTNADGAAEYNMLTGEDAAVVDFSSKRAAPPAPAEPAEPVALSDTGRAALALARLAASPRPQPRRPPAPGASPVLASPAAASLQKTLGEVQAFSDLLSTGQRSSTSDARDGVRLGNGNAWGGRDGAGAAVEAASNFSGSSGVAERVRAALATATDRTQREAQLRQPPSHFHRHTTDTEKDGDGADYSTRPAYVSSSTSVSRGLPPLAPTGTSVVPREGVGNDGPSTVKVPGIVSAAAALVFARNSGRSTPELPASVSSSTGDAPGRGNRGSNGYFGGTGGSTNDHGGYRGGGFEDSNVSSAVSLGSGHFFGASEMETAASGGSGNSARSSQAASLDDLLYRPGDYDSSSGDEEEDEEGDDGGEGRYDDEEGYDKEDERAEREEHEKNFEGTHGGANNESDESEELLPNRRNRSEARAAGVVSPTSDNAAAGATSTTGELTGEGTGRAAPYDPRPISPGTELDDEAAAGRMAWLLREALGGSLGRPEDRRTLSSSSSAGRRLYATDATMAGNATSQISLQQQPPASQAAAPGPFERFASGAASTMASWSLGRASSFGRSHVVAEDDGSLPPSTSGAVVDDEDDEVINRSSFSLSRGQARGIASGGDLVSHFLGALHNSVDVEEDDDEDEQSGSTALSAMHSHIGGSDLRGDHGVNYDSAERYDQDDGREVRKSVPTTFVEPTIEPPPAAPAPSTAATVRLAAYRNTRRRHEELSAQVISPARPTSPDEEVDDEEAERVAAAAAEADRRASAVIAAALAAAEDAASEAASLLSSDGAPLLLLSHSNVQVKDSNPNPTAEQGADYAIHVDAKKTEAERGGDEFHAPNLSQHPNSPREPPSHSAAAAATAATPPLLPSNHYSPPLSPRSCSRSPAPPRRRNPLKLSPRTAGVAATRAQATTPQKGGVANSGAGDAISTTDADATSPKADAWSPEPASSQSAKHRRKTSPPLPPSPFVGMSSTALRAAELEADVVVEMVAAALRRSGSPMPKLSPSRKHARTYHDEVDQGHHFCGADNVNRHEVSRDDAAAALPPHSLRPSTLQQRPGQQRQQQQQSYAEFAAATKAAAVAEFDKGAQQVLKAATRSTAQQDPSESNFSSSHLLHRQKSTPSRNTALPLQVPQSAPPLGDSKESSRLRGRKRLSDASPAHSSGAPGGPNTSNANKKVVKGVNAASKYPPPRGRSQSLGGFEDLDTLRATQDEEGSVDSGCVSHRGNGNDNGASDRDDINEENNSSSVGGGDGDSNGGSDKEEEGQAGDEQRSRDEWGGNWGCFNPKLAYGTRVFHPSPPKPQQQARKDWPSEHKLPSYAMLARAADDHAAASTATLAVAVDAAAAASTNPQTPTGKRGGTDTAPRSEDKGARSHGIIMNGEVSSSSRGHRSKLKRSPNASVSSFASARSRLSESHYLRASGGDLGRHRQMMAPKSDSEGEACVTRWAHWLSLSFISAALLAGSGVMLYQSFQSDLATTWGNQPYVPSRYHGGGVSMAASRDTAAAQSSNAHDQASDNTGAHTPIRWNTETSGHSTDRENGRRNNNDVGGDSRGSSGSEGSGSGSSSDESGSSGARSKQRARPPHATLWPRPSSKLREGGRIALKPEPAAASEAGLVDVEAREAAEAEAATEAIRQRLAARQAAHARAEASSSAAATTAATAATPARAADVATVGTSQAEHAQEAITTRLPSKRVEAASSTVEVANAESAEAAATNPKAEVAKVVQPVTAVTKPASTEEVTPEPTVAKASTTLSKPVDNTEVPKPASPAAKPKTCSPKTAAPFKPNSTSAKPEVPIPKSCAAKTKTKKTKASSTSTTAKPKACSAKTAAGAAKLDFTSSIPARTGAKLASSVAKTASAKSEKPEGAPMAQPTTPSEKSSGVIDKPIATPDQPEASTLKATATSSKSDPGVEAATMLDKAEAPTAQATATSDKLESSKIPRTTLEEPNSSIIPSAAVDEASESAANLANTTNSTTAVPTMPAHKPDVKSSLTEGPSLTSSLSEPAKVNIMDADLAPRNESEEIAPTKTFPFEATPLATIPPEEAVNAPKTPEFAPPATMAATPAQNEERFPSTEAPRRTLSRRPRPDEGKSHVPSKPEGSDGARRGAASPKTPSLDDLFAELEADSAAAAAAAGAPSSDFFEVQATAGDGTTAGGDQTDFSDTLLADDVSSTKVVVTKGRSKGGAWGRAGSAGRAVTVAVGRVVGFPVAVTGHFAKAAIHHIPAALVLLVFALI